VSQTPDWSGLTDAGDGVAGPLPPPAAVPGEGAAAPFVSERESVRPSAKPRRQKRSTDGDDADPESRARAIVLRQLTGAAKSRKQLEDKLAQREIPAEAARAVLDRFEELQLIDDEAFAEAWVRSRAQSRGLAGGALRRELRDKGIPQDMADRALEQLTAEDEDATARELARRKLRSVPPTGDRDKSVRRIVGMLGRKGYGPSVAFRVANDAWAEHVLGH
jgi:regulatory protein